MTILQLEKYNVALILVFQPNKMFLTSMQEITFGHGTVLK